MVAGGFIGLLHIQVESSRSIRVLFWHLFLFLMPDLLSGPLPFPLCFSACLGERMHGSVS